MVTLHDLQILPSEYAKPKSVYVDRVELLLPNFPDDVIETWFNDHPRSMEMFFDLGYEHLRFQQVDLSLSAIGAAAVFRPGAKPVAHLVDCRATHPRLISYMEKHGVWPRRPILLDTANSVIPEVFPHKLQEPLHLIEGNHRLALAIAGPFPICPTKLLPFWLVTIRPEVSPTEQSEDAKLPQPEE